MAAAFEKGDQCRQAGTDEAGPGTRQNFGVVGFLAPPAEAGLAAMFANFDRRADDLDLLHNSRGQVERPGAAAAVGTDGDRIVDVLVDLFERKRRPLVPRMAGLPTPLPFAAANTAGSRRLDDVARRRLEEFVEFFFEAAS